MALSNAERQRRFRARRKANQPVRCYRRPKNQPSRPTQWREAVQTLARLCQEYAEWRDALPEALRNSPTGETLEDFCALVETVDWDSLADIDLPRGFGRD